MKTRNISAMIGAAAVAALGIVVTPAHAGTTTICLNSHVVGTPGSGTETCSSGGAYGTDVNAADTTTGNLDTTYNGGKAQFSSSFVTVKCTSASSTGASASNGTGGTFSAFSFTNCTDGLGNAVTVTANCLTGCTGSTGWTSSAVYNTTSGGDDGTLTVTGPSATYQWQLVDSALGATCKYSPTTNNSSTGSLWNVGNSKSGLTSGKGGVTFSSQSMTVQSGSTFGCTNGTFTAGFDNTGNNPSGVQLGITQ